MELMVNDEYFGKRMIGTRDEFRVALSDIFPDWYRDYDGEMSLEEYIEDSLDSHLARADAHDIENYERINA